MISTKNGNNRDGLLKYNDKNFEIVQKMYIGVNGCYEDDVNMKKINYELYKYLKFNLKNIIIYGFFF